MALLPAPLGPNTIRAYQGVVDIYYDRRLATYVARKWPRYHRPSPTNAWQKTHENMVEAQAWVNAIGEPDRAAYRRASSSSDMRWRDLPMKAALLAPAGRLRLAIVTNTTATRDETNTAQLTISLAAPPGYALPEASHTLRLWYGVLPGLCPSVIWLPTYPDCNPTAGRRRLYASPDPFTAAVLAEYNASTGTILASVPVDCSWDRICWMLTDRAPGRPTRLLSGPITTTLPPCVIPYRDCATGEVIAKYTPDLAPEPRFTWLRPGLTAYRTHRADPIPGEATWPPPCEIHQPGGASSCASLTPEAWATNWPAPALPCYWYVSADTGGSYCTSPGDDTLRITTQAVGETGDLHITALGLPTLDPSWSLSTTVALDIAAADPAHVWLAALAWDYGYCGLIFRPDWGPNVWAIIVQTGPYGYAEHRQEMDVTAAALSIIGTPDGVTLRVTAADLPDFEKTLTPARPNAHARIVTSYGWGAAAGHVYSTWTPFAIVSTPPPPEAP